MHHLPKTSKAIIALCFTVAAAQISIIQYDDGNNWSEIDLVYDPFIPSIAATTDKAFKQFDNQPDEFLLSKGSFVPDYEGPLMSSASPLVIYSDNIKNNSRGIDFGNVSVTGPPDHMMLLPPYESIFYITNEARENVSINSIKLTNIDTPGQTPFTFCGLDYNKTSIELASGYSQTMAVCFYPDRIGTSNATIQFFDNSTLLANVPISGNGVNPINQTFHISKISKNSFNNANIIKGFVNGLTPTNNDSELNIAPHTIGSRGSSCYVEILGGGERPNPEVDGEIPTHIDPEVPPDDGLNITDIPENHLHKINVGELVKLNVKVDGIIPENVTEIKWTISDPKIKDYDESIPGNFTTIPLSEDDYKKSNISFYWKEPGQKNVTVSVTTNTSDGLQKCSNSRTFTVERNSDDIERQAEDFYIFNHNATVLHDHYNWHVYTSPINIRCEDRPTGEEFFKFHKSIIFTFDSWRTTFGYQNISALDPSKPLPNKTEFVDKNRLYPYIPQLMPSYYTIDGGRTFSLCSAVSERPGNSQLGINPYHYNVLKLGDFKNASDLANELEPTWHGTIHVDIGGVTPDQTKFGDMSVFNLAPKDPLFWKWHKYLDQYIYDKYVEIGRETET